MTSGATIRLLVGDRFEAFADQETVRTVSQLVRELRAGAYHDADSLVLIEGQAVTPYDWQLVRDELARLGLTATIRETATEPLCSRTETHKHRESNVLIAGLHQAGDNTFRACLRVHNDEELQLDHQAAHVQGMVVLEAARQMYLAVCERYYASRWPQNHYSYVFDRLETGFRNFVFPVETTIECEVVADLSDPELLGFDLEIKFGQAGLRAATVRMVGTALHTSVMARKERRGAERAVRYTLKNLAVPVG